MNSITALTKRLFNTPFQTGNNKLATLLDVNNIIEQIPVHYLVNASAAGIAVTAGQKEVKTKVISTLSYATFGPNATQALLPGKNLPIATVNAGRLGFTINSINVTVGTDLNAWDGGDLSIFLGSSLIGTISAADLVTANGFAATYKLALNPLNMKISTGTYDNRKGIVTTNTANFNVRLSAGTVLFTGMIGVTIDTAFVQDNCGTYCEKICDYNKTTSQLYCSLIKDGCAYCPTLGLSSSQIVVN